MNIPARGNRYFLFILIYQVAMSLLGAHLINSLNIEANLTFWLAASQLLIFIPPFLLYLVITRQKVSQVLPLEDLSLTNLGLIILMSLAVQPLMMFLSSAVSLFFENDVAMMVADVNSGPFPITLLVVALIPSICEEITMRGVILTNYSQVSIKKAALINGLFFGILHFSVSQFLYAAVMGAIFVYLVRYTRSIYASVISHFVINGSQSLLSLWAVNLMEANPELFAASEIEPTFADKLSVLGSMAIVVLIFLPVFAFLFRSFILYNKKRNIGILLTEKVMSQLDQNPYVRPKMYDWAFWCIILFYIVSMGLLLGFGQL